ncbi:hypothetical protein LBMAG42_21850 [Deltaproteobacteria bacterium]|nr:hypothetical protein LBMAG42_21850 [Deltaproteobacteria bacterium]
MIRFAPLLLVAACAQESFAPEATDAFLEVGPTVKVATTQDNTVVSLYPIRLTETGEIEWMGNALVSAHSMDGYASLQLPLRSGEFDRDTSKPNKPVTYVAFEQTTDLEGNPEAYTAIGTEVVQFWNGKSASKRRGWFVVRDSAGKPAYASTDRIIELDDSIAQAASVTLEGRKGQVGDQPVLLGFSSPEGVVAGWVGEVSETFSYKVEGDAPYLYVGEAGSHYIDMFPEAFVDSDSDGARGEEEVVVGAICYGESQVFISWESPAMTPQDAFAYNRAGRVTGWHAYAAGETMAELIPEGAGMAMHRDCAVGMTTAVEGGEANPDGAVEGNIGG